MTFITFTVNNNNMKYKIPTEYDFNAFRKKLKDALGEDYEVEIKKEVFADLIL